MATDDTSTSLRHVALAPCHRESTELRLVDPMEKGTTCSQCEQMTPLQEGGQVEIQGGGTSLSLSP